MEEVSGLVRHIRVLVTRSAAFSTFLGLLEHADRRRPNLLRVLTYHRIDEPDTHPRLCLGLLSATPAVFDQQMSYLAANYHVVSMHEVIHAYRSGTPLPPRAVLLTFDDAYRDFAMHAWPTLKRYRLPATLFVPTAFPDQPELTFWWDRLYQALSCFDGHRDLETPVGWLPLATARQRANAFTRLRNYVKKLPHSDAMPLVDQICGELDGPHPQQSVLSWDTLRRLAHEGVTMGAHTRTHPLMNRVSPEEARAEAIGSLRDLERQIGPVLPIFAYPSGGYTDEVVRILEHEGFILAFTTIHGVNDVQHADRLRLRRINVGRRTSLALLRAQLLPWSIYLNRWRLSSNA